MQKIVYLDILIGINMFITYLLLLCTCTALKIFPNKMRLFCACLVGAAYSLMILAPNFGFIITTILKAVMCISIVCIAFRPVSLRQLIRYGLFFFGVNAGFAGIMLLLQNLLPVGMIFTNNGSMYFNISFLRLFFLTLFCYILFHFFLRLFAGRKHISSFHVQVEVDGCSVEVTAMLDTGNSLYEPMTGFPVAIVSYQMIEKLLPLGTKPYFKGNLSEISLIEPQWMKRITTVKADFAVGNALLPAFRPDRCYIYDEKKSFNITNCVLAVTKEKFTAQDYEMLLHPDMLTMEESLYVQNT